jgi:excisionase family DNA binding protein
MIEKFIATNYDREDLILMIKEAFKDELKAILTQQENESDFGLLLSRKEVAELLKVSLVTVSKYQREGRFPYSRLGRHIYFKKGEIMKALETPIKYQHKRW